MGTDLRYSAALYPCQPTTNCANPRHFLVGPVVDLRQASESAWIHHVDTLVPPRSFVFQRVPLCSTFGAILWIIVVEWNIEKYRRTPGNPSNKLQNSYREFDSHTRLHL